MSLRVLKSVSQVLAEHYQGIPVEISEVPQTFDRPCFFVFSAGESTELKSIHVYQENLQVQIVYFGVMEQADQGMGERLYQMEEELTALFLLRMAVPILPLEGRTEKKRFAKIESFTSDCQVGKGALHVKMVLHFTEDVPKLEEHELIGAVDLKTEVNK